MALLVLSSASHQPFLVASSLASVLQVGEVAVAAVGRSTNKTTAPFMSKKNKTRSPGVFLSHFKQGISAFSTPPARPDLASS